MTIARQDQMPARRRYRQERLAVLALLALGSNLGCGKDIVRVPFGHVTPSMTSSSPPPMAAMRRTQAGHAPVALRADYGSSLNELFPASYINPPSSGTQLASRPAPKPPEADPATASAGDLLAACEDARIAPPARPSLSSPPRLIDPNDAFQIAHIPPPRVRRQRTGPLSASRPGQMTLAEASSATRIALPKPPQARVRTQSSSLAEASAETGISLPIDPTRPTAVFRASEPDAPANNAGAAFETTQIAPPIPAGVHSEPSSGPVDSAFEVTNIPPPAPAHSRQSAEMPPADLPGLPPRQLDARVFATSKEPAGTEPPPPPAEAPAGDSGDASGLSEAFEATRIAPPNPVRGPQPASGSK